MRKLAILLVLAAAPVLAEDDAAALFYRGFWLEQAEGKLDEAAALYAQLLKEKPDAPEAPRALLGLIRIKVARNEDPKELVAELERRYPGAREEIAGAKGIPAPWEFDPQPKAGDAPVLLKLKDLYSDMLMGVTPLADADRLFLVDLGSTAHAMLAQLLRASSAAPAQAAAGVLVEQRTPEAYALLGRALLDDAALFRSAIVTELQNCRDAPAVVVDALAKLHEGSAPRLRAETTGTLARLASRDGDGRDRVFAALTRALSDDDLAVRYEALAAISRGDAPDAYLDVVLRLFEGGHKGLEYYYRHLPRFADRPAFRERIEKALEPWNVNPSYLPEQPSHEEGALLLARKVTRDLAKGQRRQAIYMVAQIAAQASPRGAGLLLAAALELDDVNLVGFVNGGMGERDRVKYLGEEASRLRALVIAMAPGVNEEGRRAVGDVLDVVGIAAEDFPAILDGLRRRGDRGLPAVLLDDKRLRSLGPANAGALVEFCRDQRQTDDLLAEGSGFAKREDGGVEFFKRVVPKAGPSSAGLLRDLVEHPALVPLVAERLLAAGGPEWGWTIEGPRPQHLRADKQPGPYVWSRLRSLKGDPVTAPPLRALVMQRVQDPRAEVALAAAAAAKADGTDAGTNALKQALQSKWPDARAVALRGLVTRVTDAPALVREFAKRPDLVPEDRAWVGMVILEAKNPAMTAVAADLLGEDIAWDGLWEVYHLLDAKAAVEDALAAGPTVGSLGVLVRAQDPRRIEIFRSVLKGTDTGAINTVLPAVYDQYLVELGEETLAQLRNPDEIIRKTAGAAIERLKFYAEAQKAFEK